MNRKPEQKGKKKEDTAPVKGKNLRSTGIEYEALAEKYLCEQGYEILERNYYCRMGEIDLIARQDKTIVFCEVKYRSSLAAGHPLEAVNRKKQRTIAACAGYYLMERGCGSTCCRFDVIGFLGEELIHIPDAFSCGG